MTDLQKIKDRITLRLKILSRLQEYNTELLELAEIAKNKMNRIQLKKFKERISLIVQATEMVNILIDYRHIDLVWEEKKTRN